MYKIFRKIFAIILKVNTIIILQSCLLHSVVHTVLSTLIQKHLFFSLYFHRITHKTSDNKVNTEARRGVKKKKKKLCFCCAVILTSQKKRKEKKLRTCMFAETQIDSTFPKSFPAEVSPPCHMSGGCRSSLQTSVRRDGWHAPADTTGPLNISVF